MQDFILAIPDPGFMELFQKAEGFEYLGAILATMLLRAITTSGPDDSNVAYLFHDAISATSSLP